MKLVIVTGLSGAGRTETVRCFEDMGFFCVDNLPPSFIKNLVELFSLPGSKIKNVALVCDVRGKEYFPELYEALDWLKNKGIDYQILFLEANDESLIKRFKETRRKHPLAEGGQIINGIKKETILMEKLRGLSDMVINTTDLEIYQLRDTIKKSFLGVASKKAIKITVLSFGYKYGVPLDADIVLDSRFLPNPHYVPELKELTGLTDEIKKFVLSRRESKQFLKKIKDFLNFLIPNFIKEGKTHLLVSIGCTGGMHRSVALTEEMAKYLAQKGYDVTLRHRDIEKENE
ncbi:MAG: RNase adapter RapZ [Actinomycetia bacterium]|nr:RNase adapter RapZ [Actinomycetes bacterium]